MINLQEGGECILAVDVGAGTQDILFFDPKKKEENNIKFVLPSQTRILAKKISKIKEDLLITGSIMGGGPITSAIHHHLKRGYRVVMTEHSARTVRDNLEEVRKEGVEIVSDDEAESIDMVRIATKDVDLDFILDVVGKVDDGLPDFIGIAVQDHGYKRGKSDRAFRFEQIRDALEKGVSLEDFLYERPPPYYTRMNAVVDSIKNDFDGGVAVVDSKFAAVAGAIHEVDERPCLCVDVGNGHTLAALIGDGVDGAFEHHTHALSGDKLVDYLKRFANGDITNEEVFNDDGHGCFIKNAPGIENVKRIIVTGPKRGILKNNKLGIEFAHPYGDVMMTGPVGIIDLVRSKY